MSGLLHPPLSPSPPPPLSRAQEQLRYTSDIPHLSPPSPLLYQALCRVISLSYSVHLSLTRNFINNPTPNKCPKDSLLKTSYLPSNSWRRTTGLFLTYTPPISGKSPTFSFAFLHFPLEILCPFFKAYVSPMFPFCKHSAEK